MSAAAAGYARAIKLLIGIRDRIELGITPPNDLAERNRQTLIDLGDLARLIRELAERS